MRAEGDSLAPLAATFPLTAATMAGIYLEQARACHREANWVRQQARTHGPMRDVLIRAAEKLEKESADFRAKWDAMRPK